MLIYSLHDRAPGWEHLAGATLGKSHFAPLRSLIEGGCITEPPGRTVLLSFNGFASATASYIKATAVELYELVGAIPPGSGASGEPPFSLYPMVSGLNEELRGEIIEVFSLRRLCLLEALEWQDETVLRANLIGFADSYVLETITYLCDLGQTTASELREKAGGNISTTAWNNRLYDVYRLRLARRTKQNRQWVYEPVALEITIGDE